VIVTDCPPAAGPLAALIDVTVGTAPYVYSVFAALVPPARVTRTLAVPAVPAAVVAVIEVALTTVTPVAATPPIVTPVAPVKSVPVIVTLVPPAIGPLVGLIPLTVGKGTTVATCTALPLLKPYDVTAAVRLPTAKGCAVNVTVNCVLVAAVTVPAAPLLNVTRLFPAVGSNPVPAIVIAAAPIETSLALEVTTGNTSVIDVRSNWGVFRLPSLM